ncbi:MAG: VOC family protein [Actinomycetota bacterium]
MAISLTKDSIDLGIVVRDAEAALGFYRDVLGFDHVADTPMPAPFAGTMHRLMCGTSLIKLVALDDVPAESAAPGGLGGASGYRYWTISVADIEGLTARCRDAGREVPIDCAEIRPGVRISMIVDPDGNWVELLENNE